MITTESNSRTLKRKRYPSGSRPRDCRAPRTRLRSTSPVACSVRSLRSGCKLQPATDRIHDWRPQGGASSVAHHQSQALPRDSLMRVREARSGFSTVTEYAAHEFRQGDKLERTSAVRRPERSSTGLQARTKRATARPNAWDASHNLLQATRIRSTLARATSNARI
jgi:hypothetical protein